MQARLKKTVVLVGMMGAGKTAVGKAVAGMLHAPFLDSDAEIEKAANMTIPEIFERDGEPFFRIKERQIISRLLEREKGVLSTGGGAYMAAENREIISKEGVAVWLNAESGPSLAPGAPQGHPAIVAGAGSSWRADPTL